MKNLFQYIRERFSRQSKDAILLKACREGNAHAAAVALKAGANPNVPVLKGTYSYCIWKHEPQYSGTVYLTPILLAATSAFGKREAPYQDVINVLMQHPSIDLEHVVSGHEKEWHDELYYRSGAQPDKERDYTRSLQEAICFRSRGGTTSEGHVEPADLYPISADMASFLNTFIPLQRDSARLRQALQDKQPTL